MSLEDGFVVEQTSGGPTMIVTKARKDRAKCVWFDPEKNKMQASWFPIDALKIVRAEQ